MRLRVAVIACVLGLGGCGSDSADRTPAASRAAPMLPAGAPAELREVREQAGRLLDGGRSAFERRLRDLRGHPVVINKWASWCPPCRAEFPFFASQAKRRGEKVAFLGVDAQDVEADARRFLSEQPVPYPSYSDPDQEVAGVFRGRAAFPTTAFYDSRGELAYLKQGGYASERKLAEDIERYAR